MPPIAADFSSGVGDGRALEWFESGADGLQAPEQRSLSLRVQAARLEGLALAMPSLGLKLLDREFSLATDRAVSRRIRKRFEEKRKKPGFGDEPPAFGDISWATRMNRPDLVEKHVEEGIHVNVTRWSGFMPLHRAAGEGNTEALEKLIELGAIVEPKTYATWDTPLHLACANGHHDAAVALLKAGARWDCLNKAKLTPEMVAAKNGRRQMALKLASAYREIKIERDHKYILELRAQSAARSSRGSRGSFSDRSEADETPAKAGSNTN